MKNLKYGLVKDNSDKWEQAGGNVRARVGDSRLWNIILGTYKWRNMPWRVSVIIIRAGGLQKKQSIQPIKR